MVWTDTNAWMKDASLQDKRKVGHSLEDLL